MSYHKDRNDPASEEQLERAKARLKELGESKASLRQSRFPALEALRDSIAEARNRGVSLRAIAGLLSDVGITVTKHDVQMFCWQVLKEARPRRKRAPRAPRASKAATATISATRSVVTNPVSPSTTFPTDKPGFRVGHASDL